MSTTTVGICITYLEINWFVNISSFKLFISCSTHFHVGVLVIHTSVPFHFNYIMFSLFWDVKFWGGRVDKVAANNEKTEKNNTSSLPSLG